MPDPLAEGAPAVAVFHPGTQRSPYTARVLDENGLLAWYATGIYYDPSRPPALFPLLPRRMREAWHRECLRRHLPGLDAAKVRRLGSWEWLVVGAGRARLPTGVVHRLIAHRNLVLGKRVGRWLRQGVDVLYCYNSSALTAFRAARDHGVRRVLDQTSPTLPVWREVLAEEKRLAPPEWQPTLRFRGQWLGARCESREAEELALADLVLCGSGFCAASVERLLGSRSRVRVLPYGVDVESFTPRQGPRPPGFTVLTVGSLKAEKGLWYLLQAARRAKIPGLQVRLVGHQEIGGAALAPYEDLVTHVPHVPRMEMPQQYHEADVYVLPTLIEGSSNTVYEAMASGLPIITTPNAGSVIRHGVDGLLVPIRDPQALSDRLRELYEDADLRATIGAAVRASALEFTWQRYGQQLAELMRDLR